MTRAAAGLLLALALAGCRRKPVEAPPLVVPPAPPAPATAGTVVDGRFVDALYPFSIDAPPGWLVTPGVAPDALRVTLVHQGSGAQVEVRVVAGGTTDPLARAGCTWDFVDTARYRDLRLPLTVTVATCAPDDPLQPRVLSWGFLDRDLTWHVDAVLSTTRPREARAAVEELVGTFRLR